MTLLEFIIKLRLDGAKAARDLGGILNQANRTAAGMSKVGKATDGTNKSLKGLHKNTTAAQGALGKLLSSVRVYGRSNLNVGGGLGVSVAPKAVVGALRGLPGLLGGLSIGVGATIGTFATLGLALVAFGYRLSKTIPDIKNQQSLMADIAFVVEGKTPEEKRANLKLLEKQSTRGVSSKFEGRDILAGVDKNTLQELQFKLLAADIPLETVLDGKLLTALATLKRADPSADIDKLVAAVAYAGPLAIKSGKDLADASYMVAAVGNTTTYRMEEISTALATIAPEALNAGLNLEELGAVIGLVDKGFLTASRAAIASRQVLSNLGLKQGTKGRKEVRKFELENNLNYRNKDGSLRNVFDVRKMLLAVNEDMAKQGRGVDFDNYLSGRFNTNGKQFWLQMLQATSEEVNKALSDANSGAAAATFAASVRATTIEGIEAERLAVDRKFAAAADNLGVDQVDNFFTRVGIIVTEALTVITQGLIEFYDIHVSMFNWLLGINKDRIKTVAPVSAKPSSTKAPSTALPIASRAQETKNLQTQIVADAGKIDSIAASAADRVNTFQPMLRSAQSFAVALPLFTKAARLGVQGELLYMLAMMQSMAVQFQQAGLALGQNFSAGLAAGVTGPSITPALIGGGGGTVVNNNQRYSGITPQTLDRTVKSSIKSNNAVTSDRRNGRR